MEKEEHCKRHLLFVTNGMMIEKPTKVSLQIIIDLEHSVRKNK